MSSCAALNGATAWQVTLDRRSAGPCALGFTVAAPPQAEPPLLLDGAAFAVLPLAMRAGRALHVAGSVSRTALRNLHDFAGAWANWSPRAFRAVPISADTVRDDVMPPPQQRALLAWDGSLQAGCSLVRYHDPLVAGAPQLAGLLHVAGMDAARHDAAVADAAARAAGALGIPLIRVSIDAAAQGAIDPVVGRLPLVAAALHLAGGGCTMGLVPRGWHYGVLLRRRRPLTHMPDLLSGDGFAVRSDGGGLGPAVQAAIVARRPEIAALLTPRDAQARRLAALGFAAAGLAPPAAVKLPSPVAAALALDLGDAFAAAAAETLERDARRPAAAALHVLRARLAAARWGGIAGDYVRWFGALAGMRAPWPR
jgi:hypothetical protein